MKSRTKAKRFFAIMLVAAVCIALFSVSTAAASIGTSTGSITITLRDSDNQPLSGITFRLYRIATAYTDRNGVHFSYTEDFAGNGMPAGNFSDSYLPVHLTAYAQRNNIAYTEQSTDAAGTTVFGNLPFGAYLIVPVGRTEGYLAPNPFIVALPIKDATSDEWISDVDASPKVEDDKGEYEETYISVKKRWKTTDTIPQSITAALLRDGVIVETVQLNAANNWYYRWDNLSNHYAWSVVETEVPAEYTVTYVTSERTVIIINTHEDYEEEPTVPPDEPPPPPDKPPEDELIDTGQLNWPVPVFATAGLLLFSIGWAMLNLGKKDEEEA